MNALMAMTEDTDQKLREYEELLIRRDQLYKDAASYQIAYTQEFGDLILENFKLKLVCIKKKKTISYCRRRLNRGLAINTDRMNAEIEAEMLLYHEQLKDLIGETDAAKNAKRSDEFKVRLAKKIYRRLAKRLHPDINKKTEEHEMLRELWDRIVSAYRRNDPDELDNLEVLVKRALEQLGEEGFAIDDTDLDERIERIERRINEILMTEPYTYGEILASKEQIKAIRNSLEEEKRDYETYLETLQKTLDDILSGEGVKLTWQMN
ncbi:MAG: hypothetical protein K6E18_05510 [Lachnospiraceae bacterium]|nr:hypothetical protein [Lachnospiraceae bacterium]